MTRAETLLALAARCEAGTGPDRELDAEIMVAVYPDLKLAQSINGHWYSISGMHTRIEEYTDSLDAAVLLVPAGWFVRIADIRFSMVLCEMLRGDKSFAGKVDAEGLGGTRPRALTAAALRARAAEAGNER